MPLLLGTILASYAIYQLFTTVFSANAEVGGDKQKATTLDEFSIPTASKDRTKPKLYGSRWITGPNVCNYGNYRTKAIKK